MGRLKMPTLVKSEHIRTGRDLWLYLAQWVSNCVLWSPKASSEAPWGCQDNKRAESRQASGFPTLLQTEQLPVYLKQQSLGRVHLKKRFCLKLKKKKNKKPNLFFENYCLLIVERRQLQEKLKVTQIIKWPTLDQNSSHQNPLIQHPSHYTRLPKTYLLLR